MAEDLLATCWTTAGNAAPLRGDERSPIALRDRIEAVSAAGYRGLGLNHADLVAAREEYGDSAIRTMLADSGIVHLELELLSHWWADGPRRQESDRVRHDLLSAAEALGARHIKVGPDVEDQPWDHDRWAGEFAALAQQAADAGIRVGLEFLPWANIKDIHAGLHLVRTAGHPAGGLIIDVWHTERFGTPAAELATIPSDRIVGVELSDADAAVEGTLFEDTRDRRRLCGQGSFDLDGFISALRTAGWTGPWGVEILSESMRRSPLRDAVLASFTTAAAALDRSMLARR